jgi:hypothetical protein
MNPFRQKLLFARFHPPAIPPFNVSLPRAKRLECSAPVPAAQSLNALDFLFRTSSESPPRNALPCLERKSSSNLIPAKGSVFMSRGGAILVSGDDAP